MDTRGKNLEAASDVVQVDRLNADFYKHIQYPGPLTMLDRLAQPDFWSRMLAHDVWHVGDPSVLPHGSVIWVAGCGRNQALITALKFPMSQVIGSDLSEASLEACRENAEQLGVRNLELRRESINDVTYRDQYDYIICTGVIHHNADPRVPLAKLSRAMKPSGILELMVYNEYHRFHPTAFQQVIRTLCGTSSEPDYVKELPWARKLVKAFTSPSTMDGFLSGYRRDNVRDAYFGDSLLQPVEHSFTIKTLDELARACELELATFCVDQFSRASGTVTWNLHLDDAELREKYFSLPDVTRWHLANLMLQERSPRLWFYLQRRDCPRTRKAEQEICADFLDSQFQKTATTREVYTLGPDGKYSSSGKQLPFPGRMRPASEAAAKVYDALDETQPIRKTFARVGLDTSFPVVDDVRIHLATSAFPFMMRKT